MGNYSELFLTNLARKPHRGELETEAPYLLIKYQLPIAWLALFEQGDLRELPINDPQEKWPYLIRSKESALRLLRARQPWLMARFPQFLPHWLDEFIRCLDATPYEYVHLDTSDIGMMGHDGATWTSEMRNMLESFTDESLPSTIGPPAIDAESTVQLSPWKSYCAFFAGAYASPQCELPYCYVGASGSGKSAPWEPLDLKPKSENTTPSAPIEQDQPKVMSRVWSMRAIYEKLHHAATGLFKPRNLVWGSEQSAPVSAQPTNRFSSNVPNGRKGSGTTLQVGQPVTHFEFGPGAVEATSGAGDDEIVSVKFNSGETKWLAVKYAKLQVCSKD